MRRTLRTVGLVVATACGAFWAVLFTLSFTLLLELSWSDIEGVSYRSIGADGGGCRVAWDWSYGGAYSGGGPPPPG